LPQGFRVDANDGTTGIKRICILKGGGMTFMRSQGTIYFEPIGGLCNRMRSVDSGISLARNLDKRMLVFWWMNNDLNCHFDELFEKPDGIDKIICIKCRDQKLLKFLHLFLPFVFPHVMNQKDVSQRIKDKNFNYLTKYRNIFISTFSSFYPVDTPLALFKPIKKLSEIINSIDTKNMIGVHIRRTDNLKSINNSPLYLFVKNMNEEVEKDKNVKFFLATDDKDVENQLMGKFKDKIATYPKITTNRGMPNAIQDAVVDLYCLAKCKKLIGSYWSSFTDAAGDIEKIEKIIVYNGKSRNENSQ
jgi:hypothetical protein